MLLDLLNLESLQRSDSYVSKAFNVVKIGDEHALLILSERTEHCLGHGNPRTRVASKVQVVAAQNLLALHVRREFLIDERANFENAVHIVLYLIHHLLLVDFAFDFANTVNNCTKLYELVI